MAKAGQRPKAAAGRPGKSVAGGEARLLLDGESLTPETLAAASRTPGAVAMAPAGLARMVAARATVERAIAEDRPVYGLTTGLGARVTERLSADQLAAFSYRTLRGRAHAVGTPLPGECVRAAMIVRLNTLMKGVAGASPAIAEHLARCIEAGLHPVVPETGSIGAADLCWMATLGLALIGEGEIESVDGGRGPGREMMARAGIAPPPLGPKDGLVLANNSSLTAAIAGLALADATCLADALLAAAGLSMEAFRANLSPLDRDVLAVRRPPGQDEAAGRLGVILEGSQLHAPGAARRLQDPVSIRNIVQIHGSLAAALAFARGPVEAELNGSSDNPLVLADGRVLSSGGYYPPLLALGLETVSRSIAATLVAVHARVTKLLTPRLSDLPLFLARPGADTNAFAPVLKIAEALVAEALHLSCPAPVFPSLNADGVEDAQTNAPIAAKALRQIVEKGARLAAIELLAAAQAVDLAGVTPSPVLGRVHRLVREVSPPIGDDRPLGAEIDMIAGALVRSGALSRAIG
ncbi:MAG: aromatic amino acid ammonia-lyase [Hyphomicrobiaceae bacterium]